MKLGNEYVKVRDIIRFNVSRVTSVEIRVNVYLYNGTSFWVRVTEEELRQLEHRFLIEDVRIT